MLAKRHTLANALRVAAEQYEQDAAFHAPGGPADKGEALMDARARASMCAQFERQSAEARKLADDIEQSDTIRLED